MQAVESRRKTSDIKFKKQIRVLGKGPGRQPFWHRKYRESKEHANSLMGRQEIGMSARRTQELN